MYVPTAFQETDRSKVHDFIEASPFGMLVSIREGEPFASHLPFLLERDAGTQGCLVGHMAKANPQWQDLEGKDVLAVFSGPHTYISPSWYQSENVVPTWNYVAVHAYGSVHLIENGEELARVLSRTVNTFERSLPTPWPLDTNSGYFHKMTHGVVGFRIVLSRLEGKWKLGQNHPRERRERVVQVLERSASPDAQEIARLMAEALIPPPLA
jgi:transcriptional regulator